MNNSVLKKAFIESQLDFPTNGTHEFSREFDMRMERLIRMQSGICRLINTAGKRAACIALAGSAVAHCCGMRHQGGKRAAYKRNKADVC